MKIFIKDAHFKDAMKLFRSTQNFLKHADNDPNSEINDLSHHDLALVILFTGKNFSLLEKRLTPALSIFLHWFGAAEPRMLKKHRDTHSEFFKLIEGLRGTFHDLYSKEAFKAMHEALKQHYQPN